MVDRIAQDWRTAGVDPATAALLEFAERVTLHPGGCTSADVDRLRTAGWDDRAVNDAAQVCAYFNYINRIAQALGTDLEDWFDASGRPVDPME